MKKEVLVALAIGAGMAVASVPASAYEGGDWRTTIGMTNVAPDSTNGDTAVGDLKVDDATQLSFTGAYFFTDSFAVELLASLPFQHDVKVGGLSGVTTKHLPPTLDLQWYFNNSSPITPYIGAGVNWTTFFRTTSYGEVAGAFPGTKIEIDDSFGYALQAGLDYAFTENLFMNVDFRYISIESDVKAGGAKIGKAEINPTTVGVSLGYRF